MCPGWVGSPAWVEATMERAVAWVGWAAVTVVTAGAVLGAAGVMVAAAIRVAALERAKGGGTRAAE